MELKEYSEKIKTELTNEQIYELLTYFNGSPYYSKDCIISRTICHNGESHKLFYYPNTRLFKCYTDCSETFDIFQLVMKVQNIQLPQAVNFIAKYFNFPSNEQNYQELDNVQDWKYLSKLEEHNSQENNKRVIEMTFYDEKILKYLPHPHIIPWEMEGIKREVMEGCGICYDPVQQGIVIPHYNSENKLVGIRERTLIKEEEEFGKYKPAILNYKQYSHPLSFNLYGLNWAKKQISKIKKAVVFESEKSVLKYMSIFGMENNITVACCGSSISSYQIELLISAGAEEIIIAFDKDFDNIGDDVWKRQVENYKKINNKYGNLINITFMFDKKNEILKKKNSPIDQTKEDFVKLFNERIKI